MVGRIRFLLEENPMTRRSPSSRTRSALVSAALVLAIAALAGVALAAAKKPLTYSAYDGWRSIQGTALSRDGAWLAYALVPQDGDGELVVLNTKTMKEFRSPRGKAPVVTPDAKYVLFTIAPLKADVDKAKKDKKKPEEQPKSGLGIMDLATGAVTTIDRVKSFKAPEDSGAWVAYLLEAPLPKPDEKKDEKAGEMKEEAKPAAAAAPATSAPAEPKKEEPKKEEAADKKKDEKKKDPGTDFVLRELATGKEIKVAEVMEYAWNKPGTWLAYAVSSKTPEKDGAFAVEPASGTTVALLRGLGHYKTLTFDETGAQVAFVSDRDDYKKDAAPYRLYHWKAATSAKTAKPETKPAAASTPADAATEAAPAKLANFPAGMAVSENGKVQFSKDGARLFFGIAAAPKPEPKDKPDPIKVDIWSWKDPFLQPMQKVQAEEEKKRSFMAVLHLAATAARGKAAASPFVCLGAEDLPDVSLSENADRALGVTDVPYRQLVSWDREYNDAYLVDLRTGARTQVQAKAPYAARLSPAGNYLLWFDDADKNYHSYRIADGKTFNLTAKLTVPLTQEEWDTPVSAPPYGPAGWTAGDRSILLYDRYDIWEITPDAATAPRCVTQGIGRRDKVEFRYVGLDPEEKAIPEKTPLLLAASDDTTKASGAWRVTLAGGAAPTKVLMRDKMIGGFRKAKDADVYVFTQQSFEEFPDLWLGGTDLAAAKKVSAANPQQADYAWGREELIDYVNADGRRLQAILIKPDDFDPSKKYPMMVTFYERQADMLHRYFPPSPGTSINMSRYVSNGYVVLEPDVVYEIGYPGPSSLKCVVPAVETVLAMGFVDPKRVGVQGHSWGGYQISYLVTQTDLFAAAQAGASVVNMTSAYGGIRWGSGMSRAFQYEKTQSRIGAPLWEKPQLYMLNSPLFWVDRVHTPYLTIHDDEDDAVPWYQGIEFFSALRHLGREAYMFNYNGEKHGLRERANQKHWTVHQDEFFDHFLKGAPKPEWMEKGVPYIERGTRDIDSLYATPEPKAKAAEPAK